ncbi:hypothetical protein [Novosphingobium sp.]|uniref:hypothetical protein n=1 Tax=Novosphingobium sp. TaxID=1874826 RepID=UPI001EC5317A|nr:hypothetical protein [Novosphingobium sp.]MBK6800639.1 hypothetical protein [Novosphingobium sp.]MBK9011194.1 hypothetical protein [Novosphingobium sp.]
MARAAPEVQAIARILDRLGAETDALGAGLCADPGLAAAHMHALQAIDRIAQMQRSLAALLLADCHACALSAVGMAELQAELRAIHGEVTCETCT